MAELACEHCALVQLAVAKLQKWKSNKTGDTGWHAMLWSVWPGPGENTRADAQLSHPHYLRCCRKESECRRAGVCNDTASSEPWLGIGCSAHAVSCDPTWALCAGTACTRAREMLNALWLWLDMQAWRLPASEAAITLRWP